MSNQITLKKAADLARAALAAANAVKVATTTSMSIHSKQDPLAVIAQGCQRFQSALTEVDDLLRAHFELRTLIGAANAKCGINAALTRRASIDSLEKRYAALLARIDENECERDPEIIAGSLQAMRDGQANGSRFNYESSLNLIAVSEEQVTSMRDTLNRLRRTRTEIQDKIAALNLNTKVTLPELAAESLRRAGILV